LLVTGVQLVMFTTAINTLVGLTLLHQPSSNCLDPATLLVQLYVGYISYRSTGKVVVLGLILLKGCRSYCFFATRKLACELQIGQSITCLGIGCDDACNKCKSFIAMHWHGGEVSRHRPIIRSNSNPTCKLRVRVYPWVGWTFSARVRYRYG